MWYLIRRKPDSRVALRYSSHTSQNPDLLFQNKDNFNWTRSIYDLIHLTATKTNDLYSTIDELQSDCEFAVIPLPKLPRNINSINDVISAYPELFI